MDLTPDSLTSLAVALGLGLLIGVERERRKGEGPTRHFAGLRTFTLAALAGAVAQLLAQPLLTFVAGALVASLAAVSHLRDRSRDPGATTEVALFLTYLLGVLAVALPALAAAGGVLVAALLAAREKIVDGAVGLVQSALARLEAEGVVALDDERRAAMVSNLLVVLCGDSRATPVVNTGSLYS